MKKTFLSLSRCVKVDDLFFLLTEMIMRHQPTNHQHHHYHHGHDMMMMMAIKEYIYGEKKKIHPWEILIAM